MMKRLAWYTAQIANVLWRRFHFFSSEVQIVRKFLLTSAILCVLIPAARADDIVVFDVIASFPTVMGPTGNGTVSGNVTMDTTTGLFTDSDIVVTYNDIVYTFTGAPVLTDTQPFYDRLHFASADTTDEFSLVVLTPKLIGYTGSPLCSEARPCTIDSMHNNVFVESGLITDTDTFVDKVEMGSLSPAPVTPPPPPAPSTTPEPSSLALLGTGALGLIGAAHRRLRRA